MEGCEASKQSKAKLYECSPILTRSHGPVMWGTPPHVGAVGVKGPLPGRGVAALWGKNRFQLVPKPFLRDFLWAGLRKPLVRL